VDDRVADTPYTQGRLNLRPFELEHVFAKRGLGPRSPTLNVAAPNFLKMGGRPVPIANQPRTPKTSNLIFRTGAPTCDWWALGCLCRKAGLPPGSAPPFSWGEKKNLRLHPKAAEAETKEMFFPAGQPACFFLPGGKEEEKKPIADLGKRWDRE